jgi:hypothetical protein
VDVDCKCSVEDRFQCSWALYQVSQCSCRSATDLDPDPIPWPSNFPVLSSLSLELLVFVTSDVYVQKGRSLHAPSHCHLGQLW